MDQTLIDLVVVNAEAKGAKKGTREGTIRFVDSMTGEIEIETRTDPQRYVLKPLGELYGKGYGASSVDPKDARYMPLLLAIEEEILNYQDEEPELTDGLVALALDMLASAPAMDPKDDVLCRRLQCALRLQASLNDYSRQEIKQALGVVLRSVRRHTAAAGITGYLVFIREQFHR